jgi:type IV pilus assembly protein PilE
MQKIKQAGFTLIELMIVVAIIGLLAVIAYPSYRDYILRSHRTEGKAALNSCLAAQERWFTRSLKYADDGEGPGDDGPCDVAATDNGYYAISVEAGDTAADTSCDDSSTALQNCFIATATAQGSQADDDNCFVMTIDNTGAKASENSSGTDTTATGECWTK